MVQTLKRPKSKGQELYEGVDTALDATGSLTGTLAKNKPIDEENEALKRLTGQDFSGLSPSLKEQMVKSFLSKGKEDKKDSINSDTTHALDELESLVDQEGIGMVGSYLNWGENARYNRGKFSSLQAKLMPLFKSMFPRGMTEKEFAFINKNYIPQSSDTEETIRGKIAGLRELLSNNSAPQMMSGGNQVDSGDEEKRMKQRFDISNPSHKQRRDLVLKKTKGDRKKAEMILSQEFDL